jgi:hypothetical protein
MCNKYDKLENEFLHPEQTIICKISDTSRYALCKEGCIALVSDNSPMRKL